MTEAELLDLAGKYRDAKRATDELARSGFQALAALRRQGVDRTVRASALEAHLDQFGRYLAAEDEALAALQQARNS